MRYVLERRQIVPRCLAETFSFYAEPRNLAWITPPWLRFRILSKGDLRMRRGLRIHYRIHPFGIPQRWVSKITVWDPPHRFVDEQVHGPYAYWHHLHDFRPANGGTEIHDRVTYALPFGPFGRLVHRLIVSRQLRAIFDFRAERIGAMLAGRKGSG